MAALNRQLERLRVCSTSIERHARSRDSADRGTQTAETTRGSTQLPREAGSYAATCIAGTMPRIPPPVVPLPPPPTSQPNASRHCPLHRHTGAPRGDPGKPFAFRTPYKRINWRRVRSLNVERLVDEADAASAMDLFEVRRPVVRAHHVVWVRRWCLLGAMPPTS